MWGYIVTLVALTMDVWGMVKAWDENTLGVVVGTFCWSALNPMFVLWNMLANTLVGMAMQSNLCEALGDDVVAPMYPWSKSHIKIISGCYVIVNLSPNVHKENHNLNAFDDNPEAEDLSEALVVGTKVENSKQFNVQLTTHGQLALLRSNVLPPYDELKFLRGNSNLGMAIASAQAIGYIYGIVVRCVQGLRVSPIEAIACVLNLLILIKGVLHNFSSLGHRPLLLYLLPSEEARFIEECKNIRSFEFKVGGRFKLGVSIACGILLAVGAYFIVNFLKFLNRTCVVLVILFEVSLVLGGMQGFFASNNYSYNFRLCLMFSTVLLNLVGYVWALVVTFKYWKGEDFDVQSSNYLSQVLPYIG